MDNIKAEQQRHAALACLRCRNGKKKCDKVLPSCGRCTRLQIQCQFSTSDLRSIVTNTPKAATVLATVVSFPEIEIGSAARSIPTPLLDRTVQSTDVADLGRQVRQQVLEIIAQHGYNISQICSRYRTSIHHWFPVVHDIDQFARSFDLESNHGPETWMMLLSLTLIARMYGETHRTEHDRLYLTTKTLHSLVSTCSQPSEEGIRSGLLIALYEHCQALSDAAYISIGTCTRMGHLLGYDKTLSCRPGDDRELNKRTGKKRCLWWCIIILDRFVKLQLMDRDAPLSIPTPSVMDLLPSNAQNLHPIFAGFSFSEELTVSIPKFEDDSGNLTYNVFSSAAQAAYLLGRVIDEVSIPKDPHDIKWKRSTARLDYIIQAFSMALLETTNDQLRLPYDTCMRALLVLNRHEVDVEASEPSRVVPRHNSRAACALKSVTRMTIDSTLSHAQLLSRFFDELPVWVIGTTYIVCITEVTHGESWGNGSGGKTHVQMLDELCGVFKLFRSRWRLADKLYNAVDKARAHAKVV